MPAKTPASNMKGSSPSKSIQRAQDTAWGAQNTQASTTPQAALAKKYTKNPVPVPGNGK